MGRDSWEPPRDRLDVLATLIDAHEAAHFPVDPRPDRSHRFRMEQQGLTRKDLEPLIGTRTRVAEVLSRKRNLSFGMIRRLHEALGIPAEMLIRPTRRRAAWAMRQIARLVGRRKFPDGDRHQNEIDRRTLKCQHF